MDTSETIGSQAKSELATQAELANTGGDAEGFLFDDPRLIIDLVTHDEKEIQDWSADQRQFYNMRMNGISRTNTQVWQANLPYMHADAEIANLKPQYVGHIYNSEFLATFTSRDYMQNSEMVMLAAQWFDWEMRNKSNFSSEILAAIDIMLQNGFSFMHTKYNEDEGCLEFEVFRPLDIVLQAGVKDIQKATRFCVKRMVSPVEYVLDKKFLVRDKSSMLKMLGVHDDVTKGMQDDKDLFWGFRRYIGQIELWDFYQRDSDGWTMYVVNKNIKEQFLKEPHRLPYTIDGHPFVPFVHFPFEILDVGGVYDSRGIPQIVASDEAELTKTRNLSLDALMHTANVLYKNSESIQNLTNYETGPGKVLPQGLEPFVVPYPQAPFQNIENRIKERSEYRLASPDSTIMNLAGKGGERRTAAEWNGIMSIGTQSLNMRFRVFRNPLSELYKQAYAILTFHRDTDEELMINGSPVRLPSDAKKARYTIAPAGSESVWNKESNVQMWQQAYQLSVGKPYADEVGIFKELMTAMNPQIASKYVIDVGFKQENERTRQLMECLVMEQGDAVPVSNNDMHDIHALTTYQKIAQAAFENKPFNPQVGQAMQQHLQQHLVALKQMNPQKAAQVEQQIKGLEQTVQQELARRHGMQSPRLGGGLPQASAPAPVQQVGAQGAPLPQAPAQPAPVSNTQQLIP